MFYQNYGINGIISLSKNTHVDGPNNVVVSHRGSNREHLISKKVSILLKENNPVSSTKSVNFKLHVKLFLAEDSTDYETKLTDNRLTDELFKLSHF